jgi:hypothetical protein
VINDEVAFVGGIDLTDLRSAIVMTLLSIPRANGLARRRLVTGGCPRWPTSAATSPSAGKRSAAS